MTRFARAKGSKASNERKPEEATSWGQMRQQMLEKLDSKKEQEDKNSITSPSPSYTLEEREKESEWAVFEVPSKLNNGVSKNKKTSLERKKIKALAESVKNTSQNATKTKKLKSKSLEGVLDTKEQILDKAVQNTEASATNKLVKKKKGKLIKKVSENKIDIGVGKNTVKEGLKVKKGTKEIKSGFLVEDWDSECNVQKRKNNEVESSQQKNVSMKEGYQKKKFAKFEQEVCDQNTFHFQQRKPETGPFIIYIEGREIEVDHFDGFPVMKEDAERLRALNKEMISKGIPKKERQIALQGERRRAEKALARLRRKVCYHCRQSGHLLAECPELPKAGSAALLDEGTISGMCFTCGSTEHSYLECKVAGRDIFRFAKCFVCGEQGHIARQCTDNPCGLYPRGGACHLCGDVTHLKRDCPVGQHEKQESMITLPTLADTTALEALDTERPANKGNWIANKPKKKLVHF